MKSPIVSCAMVLTLSLGALHAGYADSATWNLNPISGDWNTAANWTPETVPDGSTDIATFDASNTTTITLQSTDIQVDSIVFTPTADSYSFNFGRDFLFRGAGIINNSGQIQNFTTDSTGLVYFGNSATAGIQTIFTERGDIIFRDTSGAGQATFNNLGRVVFFTQDSTADHGTFINGGAGAPGPSSVQFSERSSAGNAFFINNGDTGLGNSGEVDFGGRSSAANGTFINNPATVAGGSGGRTSFGDQFLTNLAGDGGDGTFIANGSTIPGAEPGNINFTGPSRAANGFYTLNGGSNGGAGGFMQFFFNSRGDTARIAVFGNGVLDISFRQLPGVTIGSLEGDGQVLLGSNQLKVGTNNLSTTFSGVIQDRGSLGKLGTGTLTLSGNNTYASGTMISAGVLKVDNESGSGTGTGPVRVLAGTLGGKGIIAGPVTVGTGSGSGAFLAPAAGANVQATLTILSALTFNADATYTYTFRAKRNRASTDMVIANEVTIASAATINLSGLTQGHLTQGLVLTLILNTSADPISGTFANLPDGGIVTINGNNFQASYEGGDGNDLTLTVVP